MFQLSSFLLIALCAVTQARPQSDVGVHDVIPGIGEYYFNGIPSNWTTAYRQCQSSDGHLTVINSEAEMVAMQELMTRHGVDSILVGFHDQFVEGVYTTITGWTVLDDLWAPLSPVGGTENSCGALNSYGLTDVRCTELSAFVCELSEDQGGVDNNDGFIQVENYGSYNFHSELLSWPEAWNACRDEKAELVVLDSKEELLAVWNAFSLEDVFAWVGLHRKWGPNDAFVTVNNKPASELGYQEWYLNIGTFETNPYVGIVSLQGMYAQSVDYRAAYFCKRPVS